MEEGAVGLNITESSFLIDPIEGERQFRRKGTKLERRGAVNIPNEEGGMEASKSIGDSVSNQRTRLLF